MSEEWTPTTQKVTIIVTEGEKTATLEREIINSWPGRETPHITGLIHSVANEIVAQIITAELQSTNEG